MPCLAFIKNIDAVENDKLNQVCPEKGNQSFEEGFKGCNQDSFISKVTLLCTFISVSNPNNTVWIVNHQLKISIIFL